MKQRAVAIAVVSFLAAVPARSQEHAMREIVLPTPTVEGVRSLEHVLAHRRSRRAIGPRSLSTAQISQLCWAAQGITGEGGLRSAPSAGALYPLELDVATEDGLYRYVPERHALRRTLDRDVREALHLAAYAQEVVGDAPVVLVISGVHARTRARYGDRAERYVAMEAGHAAQNLLLQAEALGLAAVPMGAFEDEVVRRAIGLERAAAPLYLIPIGHPR